MVISSLRVKFIFLALPVLFKQARLLLLLSALLGLMLLVTFTSISTASAQAKTSTAEAKFSGEKLQHLKLVTNYLNSLKKFQSRIRQVNIDGTISYGMLYVSRPGKMRLDYFPPDKTQLLAAGKHFTLVNTDTNTAVHYPFFTSPASILLDKTIDLQNKNIKILNVEKVGTRIVLEATKNTKEDEFNAIGKIVFVFETRPMELLGWHVVDTDDKRISVILENLKNNVTFKKRNFFRYIEDN